MAYLLLTRMIDSLLLMPSKRLLQSRKNLAPPRMAERLIIALPVELAALTSIAIASQLVVDLHHQERVYISF